MILVFPGCRSCRPCPESKRTFVSFLICVGFSFIFHFLFSDAINLITPADSSAPVVMAANCALVESTIGSVVSFLQKRMRKRKFAEESYRIASESVYSWKTEKIYRKEAMFDEDDSLQW